MNAWYVGVLILSRLSWVEFLSRGTDGTMHRHLPYRAFSSFLMKIPFIPHS
jgi:hypothetical protein